jgi:hypothetical protein
MLASDMVCMHESQAKHGSIARLRYGRRDQNEPKRMMIACLPGTVLASFLNTIELVS